MGVAVGATDVTPAVSTGTAPFAQRRLSAPELWWLRWNILASRWPGLRDAVAVAARACAACALVLAAARAGAAFAEDEDSNPASAGIRRRRGWKHAAVSAEVYRGAAALVVPFVLLPALALARESLVRVAKAESKRRRTPRFDVSVVFLADARDDATRFAARARDDAHQRDDRGSRSYASAPTTVAMMLGVLFEVLIDVARIASPPSRVPPSTTRARDASARDFEAFDVTSREFGVADGADAEPEIERALATMARATRRSGGEDAARWLETLREENALPPTTALVLVRDAAAAASRAPPKKPSGNAFRDGVSRGDVSRGGDVVDDSVWSRGPADDSDERSSSIDERPFDETPSSSVSASDSSSDASDNSGSSLSSDDPAARLAVALVVHVVPGVPRLAVGPPASARGGAGGWRGDARRFYETCPDFVTAAVVEVPGRGGAPGAFVADANAASSADVADAVASVAASLARRLGVHAVVVPVAEDAPTPFLAAALAKRGAHAALRRPADDPGFVLRLTEGGAWDGAACGAHARARRDHRRHARRFDEIGGTVAEADAGGGSALASENRLDADWTRDFAWPIAASARPSIPERHDTGSDDPTPRVEMSDAASLMTGDDPRDDAAVRAPDADAPDAPDVRAPDARADADAAAAFATDGSPLASLASLFARNDANARVAAVRAALSPADRSAGWRVLEARVGGERVGALLLETRPRTGDGARQSRRLRNRRNRRDASELAAGSRDRVWVRACWLHPDAARARRAGAYRALLRGAVAFAAARGCVRLDLGAGGAREKRRMGAMPARATAMVLFDDWTLGAPADADAEVGLSEDLLRWASNGSLRGRRGTGTDAAAAAAAAPAPAAAEAATASRPPPSAASPGPSRRAARRAARLEKRRALKLTRVASRAFREAAGAERAKTAAGGVTGAGTIPETIDDSNPPRDDAGGVLWEEYYEEEYYEEYHEEYYSDGDSDGDDDDVLFVDADDEDAA